MDNFKKLNIREETVKKGSFGRKINLMLCPDLLRQYVVDQKLRGDDQLFKISPHVVNRYLKRLAARMLGESVSLAGEKYCNLPTHRFRRRMIPAGKKTATKDLRTARRLQRQEWEKIQRHEPQLAAELKGMRKWGVATKHKPTAVRIAKKLWAEMQQQDPPTADRVISDRRPERTRPDVDVVWPSWTEQKARLAHVENKPQMPIVYPRQDLRDEWKHGLRVPKGLEAMVDKIGKVDWLRRNAMLVFDDNSPAVSREIVAQSNGEEWTNQQHKRGKRYVAQGSTSLDIDTGRIRFAMYSPGYGSKKTLAEEVNHVVYKIIRQADPGTFRAIQTWHGKNIDNGADPTLDCSEAFSKAMAAEELGHNRGLPCRFVKRARKIFADKADVSQATIENVKANWSTP